MSKFLENLKKSNKEIRESRAKNLASTVDIAQQSLMNDLKTKQLQLQQAIENHVDLSPTNADDLGPQELNAIEWVLKLQKLKEELLEVEVQLKIAQSTYDEWFGEDQQTDSK